MEPAPIAHPRILGRYALYGEIASGGMATVHLGRLLGPAGFSRTVAIKRLHPQFAKDPEFVAGFLDEARLASRIRHPNVVGTQDVVARDGEIFLVMDYIQGEALSRLLAACRRQGVLVPPRVAAAILSGVLHGLHAAHEARSERGEPLFIVHRDVSPHNILVAHDGVPFVLDFGIAKASTRMQHTREGALRGKVAYMAPEQLTGGRVGRHTDVYASAVVLWETLTTRRLFEAENDYALIDLIKTARVPPPGSLVALPPGLDAIVLTGLHPNPAQRFSTARDMAVALERCVGLATPLEIAEWVQHVAGDALRSRSQMVQTIEWYEAAQGGAFAEAGPSAPPPAFEDPTRAIAGGPDLPTRVMGEDPTRALAPEGRTRTTSDAPTRAIEAFRSDETVTTAATQPLQRAPVSAGRRAVVVASVVAAIAAAGGVSAILIARGTALGSSADHSLGTASDVMPAGSEELRAPREGSTRVAPAAPPPASAPSASPTPAPSVSAPASASASASSPAAAPMHVAAKRSPCDPWYTVDARGIKIPKVGCLAR